MGKHNRSLNKSVAHGVQTTASSAQDFLHRLLVHATGALGLLISLSFFTATYDTAQVKLTLLHMGGLLLAALWAALQCTRKKSPFTKQNLPFLLPLFIYIGWNVCCYVCAPYHLEAAEEFFRFLLYAMITLLAATEFTFDDIKTLSGWLLVTVWVSLAYATVQIFNIFFPGFDPMPWHGFFSKRVFSTHANPNFFADFAVFSSCVLFGMFLAKRKKILLFPLGLAAAALFFTESKGAWLAYASAVAIGLLGYVNFCAPALRKYRLKFNALALAVLVGAGLLSGLYTAKRFQSVSFRTHTWLGTFEMIKDAPIMGVGIGNFKTIYSAYRRPQIFYIESAHNVETQHAENELLEQWAVSGTVGLAVFLWLVVFLLVLSLRTLRRDTVEEKKYYLLGYTTAFCAILIHSLVDVSLRFASTGFFFALFMGCLLALCTPKREDTIPPTPNAGGLVWSLRVVFIGGLVAVYIKLIAWFHQITAVLGTQTAGEVLLVVASWVIFLGTLAATAYGLVRAVWLLRNTISLGILLLLLPLEVLAYCPFQANHYYSLAVSFNNVANLEGALIYFTKAVRFAPFQAEYRQFRANTFATTLDLTRRFSPLRGDTKNPSDDYTRALQDYAFVEQHSPNHPLLHHNKGQLYYTMALNRSQAAQQAPNAAEYANFKQQALQNMAQAKQSFKRSLLTDPVNPATYFYLIQIALLENDPDAAQHWIDVYRRGPEGVSETEFLNRHLQHPQINALQAQVNARRKR